MPVVRESGTQTLRERQLVSSSHHVCVCQFVVVQFVPRACTDVSVAFRALSVLVVFCLWFGCAFVFARVCHAGMLVVVDELPAPLSILRRSTSGSPVGLLVLSCRRACSCSRDVGPPCLLAIVHERMWLGYLCFLSSIFCVLYSSASPYCLPFQRRHYCHCSSSIVVACSRVSNLISSKSDFTHGSYRCCIGAVYGGSEAPTVRRSS